MNKPDEGSQSKLMDKYEVTYNFEFLDDLYQIPRWTEESKQQQKKKGQGMVH